MGRRVIEAVTVLAAVALASLLGLVLLGSAPARAGSLAGQLLPSTTAPHSTSPPSSSAPPTSATVQTTSGAATTVASVPGPTTPTTGATRPTSPPPTKALTPPPGASQTYPVSPVTTPAPTTTTTTIAPLGNSLPVSPATLPLRTVGSNAHVSPAFAILSGVGFFIALVMVAVRLFVTRSGGPDRRPVG